MKYQVVKEIKAKTANGERIIQPGQLINMPPEKAEGFVAEGKIAPLKIPYFDKCGDIVIPFDCDPKYHWWNGGQSISKTINELKRKKDEK